MRVGHQRGRPFETDRAVDHPVSTVPTCSIVSPPVTGCVHTDQPGMTSRISAVVSPRSRRSPTRGDRRRVSGSRPIKLGGLPCPSGAGWRSNVGCRIACSAAGDALRLRPPGGGERDVGTSRVPAFLAPRRLTVADEDELGWHRCSGLSGRAPCGRQAFMADDGRYRLVPKYEPRSSRKPKATKNQPTSDTPTMGA